MNARRKATPLSRSTLSLPPGSYVYTLFTSTSSSSSYGAALCSDDSVRLFDPSDLAPTSTIPNTHPGGATCLRACPQDPNTLITAGRDGVARAWDRRSGGGPAWAIIDAQPHPFLSLATAGAHAALATGTELTAHTARVAVWDPRYPLRPVRAYVESHNDDVTVLEWHPARRETLLSGSTDGLVNVYDVRVEAEEDALVQVVNHGFSVGRAGFLDGAGAAGKVYVLSHDEQFGVYGLTTAEDDDGEGDGEEEAGLQAHVFGDLREKVVGGCEYVIDVVRTGEGRWAIAAGKHSQSMVEMVPLWEREGEWEIDGCGEGVGNAEGNGVDLQGAHAGEVVRCVWVNGDGTTGLVYTGGEDGGVQAWRLADGEREEREKGETKRDVVGPLRKEKRRERGFKPY